MEKKMSNDKNSDWTNLLSHTAGARVLFATDEWFAGADNLLNDNPAVFDPDAYCAEGKVMDGWESRRRREEGHDWCIVKLAKRGTIHAIEIDTGYFTGNHVPAIGFEIADCTSWAEEESMVQRLPGITQRLLYGSIQGTGTTPTQVQQAEEACQSIAWKQLLPPTPLRPGYEDTRLHLFTLDDDDNNKETTTIASRTGTHVRINYFPDGGVARIRLLGVPDKQQVRPQPAPLYVPIATGPRCTVVLHSSITDPSTQLPSQCRTILLDEDTESANFIELSLVDNGGRGVACSNRHYGEPSQLIQSGLGRDMGDGWETARHPNRPHVWRRIQETGLLDSPLSDWCILRLGIVALHGVSRILLDTKHFRGNYPESVMVEGALVMENNENSEDNIDKEVVEYATSWFPLVERCRMAPDAEHVFQRSKGQILNSKEKVSHVRVTIYPDGGLSRVRVYA